MAVASQKQWSAAPLTILMVRPIARSLTEDNASTWSSPVKSITSVEMALARRPPRDLAALNIVVCLVTMWQMQDEM
jgi:hypothetical protein